jgi:hypothetical protein
MLTLPRNKQNQIVSIDVYDEGHRQFSISCLWTVSHLHMYGRKRRYDSPFLFAFHDPHC